MRKSFNNIKLKDKFYLDVATIDNNKHPKSAYIVLKTWVYDSNKDPFILGDYINHLRKKVTQTINWDLLEHIKKNTPFSGDIITDLDISKTNSNKNDKLRFRIEIDLGCYDNKHLLFYEKNNGCLYNYLVEIGEELVNAPVFDGSGRLCFRAERVASVLS